MRRNPLECSVCYSFGRVREKLATNVVAQVNKRCNAFVRNSNSPNFINETKFTIDPCRRRWSTNQQATCRYHKKQSEHALDLSQRFRTFHFRSEKLLRRSSRTTAKPYARRVLDLVAEIACGTSGWWAESFVCSTNYVKSLFAG
jgi:hypothetical protein